MERTVSDGQRLTLFESGYVILRNAANKTVLSNIREHSERIYRMAAPGDLDSFEAMQWLFKFDIEKFVHCGKTMQMNPELWRLTVDLVDLVKEFGLMMPSICTKPVVFHNHKKLSKKAIYHTVPAHQDWFSMQGSLNSLVVWIPLMPMSEEHGRLKVLPASHKEGLKTSEIESGFGLVDIDEDKLVEVNANFGDIVVFNSFLVHQSGDNVSDVPRWSCHFRYNDLSEETYRKRGYVNPYTYKPSDDLITPNFP